MANAAIDTHEIVRDLTATGMKTDQAEVLAKHFKSSMGDNLTRDDVREIVELAVAKLWIRMLTTQIALTVALAGIVVAANFN